MAKNKAAELLYALISKTDNRELKAELQEILSEFELENVTPSGKKLRAKKFISAVGNFFMRVAEHEIINEIADILRDL